MPVPASYGSATQALYSGYPPALPCDAAAAAKVAAPSGFMPSMLQAGAAANPPRDGMVAGGAFLGMSAYPTGPTVSVAYDYARAQKS